MGFKIVDKNIDFITWESPREDKVLVFERTSLFRAGLDLLKLELLPGTAVYVASRRPPAVVV